MHTTTATSPLDALAVAFSPDVLDRLTEPELRDRLDDARRLQGLATVALARVVDRLARAGAPRADGAATVRGWVQQQTGRSTRDAARLVRLADSLDTLPATAAAVATGQVTPESADVLLRAVDDGRLGDAAAVDRTLGSAARLPADQLRGLVRRRVAALDGAALRRDERRQHALRRAALVDQPDGMTHLHALLPAETGQRLRVALDALDTPDPQDTPDEARRTSHQRTADALDELARRTLASGDLPRTGGLVPQLTVHVDLTTLDTTFDGNDHVGDDGDDSEDARGDSDGDRVDDGDSDGSGDDGDGDGGRPPRWDDPRWADTTPGTTGFGGDLSPQTVRRLLCDAVVTRVVTAGTPRPLDVGRATRTWTGAQRRAANLRDAGCRGPHCDRPAAWTQLHHITWWRHGGTTDLHNALSLCHACHTLVHDDGWHPALDPTTAHVTWTAPDGRTVHTPARPRPGPPATARATSRAAARAGPG